MERELRRVAREHFQMVNDTTVTVRHAADEEPAPTRDAMDVTVALPALHGVIFDAHRAGQATGHQLPKDSREKATAFADQAVAVLAK
jgi:hypothetical protein